MEEKERKAFEEIIIRAYKRLPHWIKSKMNNVAIMTEDFVDTDTVREMNLDSYMDLPGLYRGVPLIERENSAGISLPDTIVLYRMPILDQADISGKSVEEVVFETLWHEVAHHFGLTEADVEKREEEEFNKK